MPRDVLIVDDVKTALENYGNEVRLNLSIEPFLIDDPRKALDVLQFYPIKVLVTDQEMPHMTGTELVKRMREKLGLRIPCIMLTGYTDKVSISDAVNLGFFRFIDKLNAPGVLVQAIRQALQRYEAEIAAHSATELDCLLTHRRRPLRAFPYESVRLIRISSVVDPFIKETEWATNYIAEKGITTTEEKSIKREIASSIEYGVNAEVLLKAGLTMNKLLAAAYVALETKVALDAKAISQEKLLIRAKHTIEVKPIVDTLSAEGHVLESREYQNAPVYTRLNCVLRFDCNCCNVPKVFDLSVDIRTNRLAMRQIEHFDKGPNRVIYTGFLTGQLVSS